MIRLPIKYRSDDDDYAPVDYQFVGSVAEGRQRREAEAIHQGTDRAVVRRSAVPDARVDAYGTHARRSSVVQPERPRRVEPGSLPGADGARVQRIAYPEGPQARGAEEVSPGLGAPPMMNERNKRGEAPEGPEINKRAEGPPEFDPPVAPEIPEWLRVAKQNNLPMADGRFRPRVVAAPMQAAEDRPVDRLGRPVRNEREAARPIPPIPQVAGDYRAAGYPPELLLEQEQRDADQEASQYAHKRRGAQRAVHRAAEGNPPAQWGGREQGNTERGYAGDYEASYAPYAPPAWQGYEQAPMPGRIDYGPADTPYAPRQSPAGAYPERGQPAQAPYVQEVYEDELPTERGNIPWLGIAAGALALVAALLWIFQMTYANRMEEALLARERAEQATQDAHPFGYRELIETQAQINNLHPAFIAAIVLNESSFRPDAESSVGARGLMQMMPDTAEWVHGKIGQGGSYSFDMMYDANTNVRYACWYMNYLSEKFRGDPVLVAAAFHAGQGTVQNWLNDSRYSADSQTIALEDMMDGPTKNYAERVLRAYAAYKRLYYESIGV